MKSVAKYNIYKGVSTALTVGTPIATLCSCSEFFIHRSSTAISAAGIFAILLTLLFAKDKLVENFKMPSTFVISACMFVLIVMIERIIEPMKYVCITTMIASGIDELTFKRFYKMTELTFPKQAQSFKHLGFMFVTTNRLKEIRNE